MDKEINKSIPIMFQKKNSFETNDTRFTNVTIWLMHLEENLNGSYFSKEVVEKAIPSLANTPILAYIEDNKNDEMDTSDHRQVLVKEDGKYKIKYIGQAYGVIPESCNPRFQTRVCDDGIERNFLVVDGLIWSGKFEDIDEILSRDKIKGQSMELHDQVDGYFDKSDNLFHFTDFKFYGACILGDFVHPAMRSSTVEVMNFSIDEFTKIINSKMEEFKQYTNSQEGGNTLEDNKTIENIETIEQEPVAEEFATVVTTQKDSSETVVETIDTDTYKVEETKVEKTTVEITETQTSEPVVEEFATEEPVVDEEVKAEEPVVTEPENFEEKVEEVVVEPTEEPIVKEVEKEFNVLETEEYKTLEEKFSALEVKFNALTEEIESLRTFKSNKELEELKINVDTITSKFELEESEISELKLKAYNKEISLEVYEEKLFALVGKKNFSKIEQPEEKQSLKFSLKATEDCPYPSLSHLFK